MFIGWAQGENVEPKRSAWLIGYAEGLLAEADRLGPDWQPDEPEKLKPIGVLGRMANGEKVNPSQVPKHGQRY